MKITSINHEFLGHYADYLRKTVGESTVRVHIKDVKSYLAYASRQKITVNLSYKLFTILANESEPTLLTETELKLLLDLYYTDKLPRGRNHILGAFLLACFNGLRVSDLK